MALYRLPGSSFPLAVSAAEWLAAGRPPKLTKETSDELIAEAKDELAVLREKAKGRQLRKEEIDPIIADLRRLTASRKRPSCIA